MLVQPRLGSATFLHSYGHVRLRVIRRMRVWRRSHKAPSAVAGEDELEAQMGFKDAQRLFSNLDSSLSHQKGSVAGASILVAGEARMSLM